MVLPAPDGSGPAALLAGGRFSPMNVLALDARMRTLVYGRGESIVTALSVCPGTQRVAEVGQIRRGFAVRVRELRTLRVVSERRLSLPYGLFPTALQCDADGSTVHLLASQADRPALARLLTVTERGVRTRWRGTAPYGSFGKTRAYLNTGARGTRLVAFDLRTGASTHFATLPPYVGAMVPNVRGTRLAAFSPGSPLSVGPPPPKLVTVDLTAIPGRVRTVELAESYAIGEVFWLAGGRIAFLPRCCTDVARVFDESLRPESRFAGWPARASAVIGSVAYGVDYEGRLLSARLPGGPVRVVRQLPSAGSQVLLAVSR